jgi:hypothetical protein
MTNKDLLALAFNSTSEKAAIVEMKSTRPGKQKNHFQQEKLTNLKNIGASGNLESIIGAEKFLVAFEFKEYAKGKVTESSLNNALDDLKIIETNARQVTKPDRYKEVDLNLAKEKMRDGNDLPLDGARKAFRAHITRLGNDEKARSSDHEKAIIQARRQNIGIAERIYIERQEKALGREPVEQQREQPRAQRKTLTKEEYGIALNLFLEQIKKEPGMNPQKLAEIRADMEKAIDEKLEKNLAEKSTAARKPKGKDDSDLER